MADSPVPLIDIAPFDAGGSDAVAAAVRAACETIGFFLITGHGVPDEVIARVRRSSRAFFDLPEKDRNRVAETGPLKGGLMRFAWQQEALAATLGHEAPGDLKEVLDYGPGFYGDSWPAEPGDLEPSWHVCYGAMCGLAGTVRRILASALGLDSGYFENLFDGHLSSLRVIDYPEPTGPARPGQLRAGVHTDYGVLTILATDDAPGGLEVRTRAGRWCAVPHVQGAFTVNLGDAMMRWTDDHWVSTPHRVVNPPANTGRSTRRQSIAFFHNLPRDTVIECLPPFRRQGTEPKYPPITYGAYAELRYRQAHGDGKRLNL